MGKDESGARLRAGEKGSACGAAENFTSAALPHLSSLGSSHDSLARPLLITVRSRVVHSKFAITTSQNCKILSIPFEAFSKICTIISGGAVSIILDAMVNQHKKEAQWCSTQIHLLNTNVKSSATVQSHSLGSLFSQQAAFIECNRCHR